MVDSIIGPSREASRAARGYVDNNAPALPPAYMNGEAASPIEGEVIDAEPVDERTPRRRRYTSPPLTGEDALAEAARVNRATGVYDRKALPRGR